MVTVEYGLFGHMPFIATKLTYFHEGIIKLRSLEVQQLGSKLISILISSDSKLELEEIKSSLKTHKDMMIVAEADCSSAAVSLSMTSRPNVVVINCSEESNFDTLITTKLIKSRSQSKVLFMGRSLSDKTALKALSVGVDGYCRYSDNSDQFISAIRSVAQGNLWIDDIVASKVVGLLGSVDPETTAKHSNLNNTEYAIFEKLSEGADIEAISNKLNVSVLETQDQVWRLLQKLSMGDEQNWFYRKIRDSQIVEDCELARKCSFCKTKVPYLSTVCPVDGYDAPVDQLIGTTFADKYEILSLEGSGATGSVYKARHRYLRNLLAIKVLHSNLMSDLNFLHRLRQEAAATMSLNHPSIVRVHDFGITVGGNAYIVMDYVNGTSLQEHLDKKGSLKATEAIDIFLAIADGLSFAHSKEVIHRDIKPSNIILVDSELGSPKVCIVDFGIAKTRSAVSLTSTNAGEIYGTPLYMSPEQCRGDSVDAKSDIYSFGCLMYETLVGRPPHCADSSVEVMHMQLYKEPQNLLSHSIPYEIPSILSGIVMKALNKKPEDRFRDIFELKTYLEGVVI